MVDFARTFDYYSILLHHLHAILPIIDVTFF